MEEVVKVWVWNCNGYKGRKAVLQQYVQAAEEKPDVIMLQEVGPNDVGLSGYVAYGVKVVSKGGRRGVCTLVRRGLPVVEGKLEGEKNVEFLALEVVFGKSGVCLCNVYNSPKYGRQRFGKLFRECVRWAGDGGLVVAGDFNARHEEFGYVDNTAKGRNLLRDSEDVGLILVSDSRHPTLMAKTAVQRETMPDLAFVRGVDVEWRNTGMDLGSDHRVVEVLVHLEGRRKGKRRHKVVDWGAFRRGGDMGGVVDVKGWSEAVVKAAREASREVEVDAELEGELDSRLVGLMEAKEALYRRWREHRGNRRLRKRVAEMNREIARYSGELARQQWDDVCVRAGGRLQMGETWRLLRHLLDGTRTRSYQRGRLGEALYGARKELGEEGFRRALMDKYLPRVGGVNFPGYKGEVNEDLDRAVETWEVRAALQRVKTRSASGPDGVSNNMLRNLGEEAVEVLTGLFNRCWESGEVPEEWKTARMVLLAKPNKPVGVQNLRPISLTSCVGKVLEHVVLRRWNNFLEGRGVFSDTMFGFREGLCAQDAMLLLKHEVVQSRKVGVVLGLDLKSAFDRVQHSAILERMSELGLGKRSYEYVRSFLTGRSAELVAGEYEVGKRGLGCIGTPQGAVISPMLFNLVMAKVGKRLTREGIGHSIYADDLTLWCVGKGVEETRDTLQRGIDAIEEELAGTGLECSHEKSAYVVVGPRSRRWQDVELRANGGMIPRVKELRVLGLWLQEARGNGVMLDKLQRKVGAAMQMVRRVASRRRGMKEESVLRLVQAFGMSHIAYVAGYLKWGVTEKGKINALIRRIYKAAIGLLACTSTEMMERLGVHNTLEEVIEAQRISQTERLRGSAVGRRVLSRVGVGAEAGRGGLERIKDEDMRRLRVRPVPRHMHPERDKGRRQARAQALYRLYGKEEGSVYVDGAFDGDRGVAVVVAGKDGRVVTASGLRCDSAEEVEEVAVAMAISIEGVRKVFSDAMGVVRRFMNGTVSERAKRLISVKGQVELIWSPAHEVGNDMADCCARGLLGRASQEESYVPVGYGEYLECCRRDRRRFPEPHKDLCREDAVLFRQLQVMCVYTPVLGRHVDPGNFESDLCRVCKDSRATLQHIVWDCEQRGHEASGTQDWPEDFKDGVMCVDLEGQRGFVQRTRRLLHRQTVRRCVGEGVTEG